MKDLRRGHVGRPFLPSSVCVCSAGAGRKLSGHSRLLVSDWSEEDVLAWLSEEGLEELVTTFTTNNIDGPELLCLTKETLSSELSIGKDMEFTTRVAQFW